MSCATVDVCAASPATHSLIRCTQHQEPFEREDLRERIAFKLGFVGYYLVTGRNHRASFPIERLRFSTFRGFVSRSAICSPDLCCKVTKCGKQHPCQSVSSTESLQVHCGGTVDDEDREGGMLKQRPHSDAHKKKAPPASFCPSGHWALF